MKYIALLLSAVMILTSFAGCSDSSRTPSDDTAAETVEEEKETPKPDKKEDAKSEDTSKDVKEESEKEAEKPADNKKEDASKEEDKKDEDKEESKEEKPEEKQEEEKKPEEAAKPETAPAPAETAQKDSTKPALPFDEALLTRPEEELKNNPNNLDDRLYSVFVNVMDRKFFRTKGKLNVHKLDADGTQFAYELTFDLNNAIDSKGNIDNSKKIDAQMKIAKALNADGSYSQGETNVSESYNEYIDALATLMTPILGDGFCLKNFSSLTMTDKQGSYQIEAVFTPAALKTIYNREIYGKVRAYIQVDAKGNLLNLGWDQTDIVDGQSKTYAYAKYSFA